MKPRLRYVVPAMLAAVAGLSSPASALEKTLGRLTDDLGGWRSSMTSTNCLVTYYNTCNGWVWIWSGWAPADRIGVCFTSCCAPKGAAVDTSYVYFWSGAPAGYGFTGTIGLYAVDANCCPGGTPIASQPLLPVSQWNGVGFTPFVAVPAEFAVMFTFGAAASSPIAITSDHPAQGPTGPVACGSGGGSCYPATRATHSFYWGPAASPFCPGSALNDGVCDVEWLWDASMHCVVSVESSSWGAIKGLYR
jgi:hypothetical protein